jgi:hypothetical protein
MSRFLLVFIIGFSASVLAQNTNLDANTQAAKFTELEHRIVELSGLLSLSDQAKTSAQHMIALSTVAAGAPANKTPNIDALVEINHAQHFGIAQNLSKRWTQVEWENRLLVLIDSIDDKNQKRIEKDLSQNILRSAQNKEKAAISNQSKAEYSVYMNKLKQRPPAVSRWKLVEALDKQSSFSQLIIKTRGQVYKEISSQVKGWLPPANWEQDTRQEVLEFLFYAYRKTPNPELKKIANSYNTPALKSFLVKVQAGI